MTTTSATQPNKRCKMSCPALLLLLVEVAFLRTAHADDEANNSEMSGSAPSFCCLAFDLVKSFAFSLLMWLLRALQLTVFLALPLFSASVSTRKDIVVNRKVCSRISTIQADMLVVWAWTLHEILPSAVVILFVTLVLGSCITWKILFVGLEEMPSWDGDLSERQLTHAALWMLLASVVAQATLPLVLAVIPRAACDVVVSAALLMGIILPNAFRLNSCSNRTQEFADRAAALSRRRIAGLLLFAAWQVLRFCRLLPPVEGQVALLIILVAGNFVADGDVGRQINEWISSIFFSPHARQLASTVVAREDAIMQFLAAASGLLAVSATMMYPKWSLPILLSAVPVIGTQSPRALCVLVLLTLDLASLSVRHHSVVSPFLSLAALVSEILSSVLLVASTWIGLSSPQLRGNEGWRVTVRRFVLGTDRMALQVCILVLASRQVYNMCESILRGSSMLSGVVPVGSIVVSVVSVLVAAPFEDEIYAWGRGVVASYPRVGGFLASEMLALPNGLLPLFIGVSAFAVLWSVAPVVVSWIVPLLGLAMALFPCVASLHAVYCGEIDIGVLREWQLFWLLSSAILPWFPYILPQQFFRYWLSAVRQWFPHILPSPRLASSICLLVIRAFIMLDRGRSLPFARQAVATLQLSVKRLCAESGTSGQLGDWERIKREVHVSWCLAKDRNEDRDGRTRGLRGRLHGNAVSASQRVLSAIPESETVTNTTREQADAECVVCCEVVGGSVAICPDGHRTCDSCFATLFDMCLNRSLANLKTDEQQQARYMVQCAGGCSKHFGVKTMTSMLTEEQAIRWEEINKKLYRDLNLDEWIRQNAAKDAEQKRADEIRASFRAADGTYQNVYQCPECGYGPKPLTACDNLQTHHGEQVINPRTGQVYRRNNACENCGWFGRHISMWVPWDGTVRPLASTPESTSTGPIPDVPPSPTEEILLSMGYTIELIRQEQVACAIRNAQREGGSVEAAVFAGVDELERTRVQGIAAAEGAPQQQEVTRTPPRREERNTRHVRFRGWRRRSAAS